MGHNLMYYAIYKPCLGSMGVEIQTLRLFPGNGQPHKSIISKICLYRVKRIVQKYVTIKQILASVGDWTAR